MRTSSGASAATQSGLVALPPLATESLRTLA
jgi:hypothetical protein